MRTEVIKADTMDAAAERILNELKYGTSRENVIYFDGWDGLGASAVLRVVAQRLAVALPEAPAGMKFDQIIHIECSKWESRRAVQRAIAEQLKLPASIMDMFDRQDEEDDFSGLARGLRSEIQQVVTEIYRHTQNHRFLVIFHHGSREDIDLTKLGLPLFGYAGNKMLWTFRGRFRLNLWVQVDKAVQSIGVPTDVFLTASRHEQDPHKLWSLLAHQEATEVAHMIIDASGIVCQPAQVEECLLYMIKTCAMTGGHHWINFDLATHSSNYWVCDGIIQQEQGDYDGDGDDKAWRAADALLNEMRLGVDCSNQYLSAHLRGIESMPHWASPGYGFLLVPANGDIFQQLNRLGVLKLSHCTFCFSSPPYLSCQSLRFLWLDHCQDQVISTNNVVGEMVNQDIHQCFQRLWVLDVRYTSCDQIFSTSIMDAMTHLRELNVEGAQDWDIGQLQGRLPNIRKLRVTKSTVCCSGHSEQDLFRGMNKMELLDFSGNRTTQGGTEFSEISTSNNCLETVVIFDGNVGLQKLSFRGCAKLKNLLLRGLFEDLHTLDLSGTVVKTIDLSAMTAKSLDEVILDNCHKLCAILWPPQGKRKMNLAKVHMDITQSAPTSRSGEEKMKAGSTAATGSPSSWPLVLVNGARSPSEFDWYISVKDARLLRSFQNYFGPRVHLEISSLGCYPAVDVGETGEEPQVVLSKRQQQQPQYINDASMNYADVATIIFEEHLLQGGEGNGNDAPTITRTWPCPPPDERLNSDCYLYTQDQKMKTNAMMEGGDIATIPSFICDRSYILHVHDSLYNTSIPGLEWDSLRWFRVERCPRLDFIFTAPQLGSGGSVRMCWYLTTFWASQLPRTRFMWDTSKLPLRQFATSSFEDLIFLHLDFCPRLIHVLPFAPVNRRLLETLEIVWCGDLTVVFPLLDTNNTRSHQEQQQKPPGATITMVDFPHLKHIHLHELPMLESICGLGRMYAPGLETIKIRGCWSLKHLPAVSSNRSDNQVECDCEKEWWNRLEWDGLDSKHHPSLYRPVHSRYYKKKMLRGSVLI